MSKTAAAIETTPTIANPKPNENCVAAVPDVLNDIRRELVNETIAFTTKKKAEK